MKYKPGDVIPLTDKLSRLVFACWIVRDNQIPIIIEKSGEVTTIGEEGVAFYFCVTFPSFQNYSIEDISKFTKVFGKWMKEDEVQKIS